MRVEDNRFFDAFSDAARKRLLDVMEYETYPGEAMLFQEDDSSDCVCLVLSGRVELTKRTRHDQVEALAHVIPGEYFGEMGVIESCGRSAGARTIGETHLAKIPSAPLMEIIRSEPSEVSLFFLRRISEYLRTTNSRFIEEILRKERMQVLGEMASSMIHDFKNPMTSIRLAAELIEVGTQDEKTTRYCRLLLRQVERMQSMAEEFLDYSQGRSHLVKEKVNVTDLFHECEMWNADYLRKNSVEFLFEPIDAFIELDRNRMMRVLQNLLSNAVEALGPDGGRIDILATMEDPGTVVLHVIDNGPGVPESIRDMLFDPFVTKGKRKGTGLGMPIAKTLVEAHGGTISFVTETGKGTNFLIRLPAASLSEESE